MSGLSDFKVLDLMTEFFGGRALKLESDFPKEQLPEERRTLAIKLRKVCEKYLDWYEEHYKGFYPEVWDQAGGNPHKVRFNIKSIDFLKDIIPDSLGIKETVDYDKEMVPILRDFAQRNVEVNTVREHFENYLDKTKEGWNKKFETQKKQG